MGRKAPGLRLDYLRLARDELDDAYARYAERGAQALDGFSNAISNAELQLTVFPRSFPAWQGDQHHRICTVARYPYKLPYRLRDDRAIILALAHHGRRPGYWTARIRSIPP